MLVRMPVDPMLLDELVRERKADWTRRGIESEYHRPAEIPSAEKFATFVQAESSLAMGQLTVWSSGEVDIDGGYIGRDELFAVHHEGIDSAAALKACLDDFTRRLLEEPSPDDDQGARPTG